jgi:arylsulfatase A-like enzyme
VPAGAVCEDLVSILDVFPSLTGLMDLPLPPGRDGRPLPMVPVAGSGRPRDVVFAEHGVEGAPTNEDEARAALARYQAEHGRPRPLPFQAMANAKIKMVRTKDWKYVYQPGGRDPDGAPTDELYFLSDDPHELVNLVDRPEHRQRVEEFRRHLLDWAILTEDRLPVPERTTDRGL